MNFSRRCYCDLQCLLYRRLEIGGSWESAVVTQWEGLAKMNNTDDIERILEVRPLGNNRFISTTLSVPLPGAQGTFGGELVEIGRAHV